MLNRGRICSKSVERLTAEREVVGLIPSKGRTNTQGFKNNRDIKVLSEITDTQSDFCFAMSLKGMISSYPNMSVYLVSTKYLPG